MASDNRRPITLTGDKTMTNATTIENAIARSISHTEIAKCEFAGQYSDLMAWLNDNTDGQQTVSEEIDGTIDVASDDWRVNVTLTA
jgi:hypothetical protein